MPHDMFVHPLEGRYATDEMKRLWSDDRKFGTWRRIWTVLANLERTLGVTVKGEPIREECTLALEAAAKAPIDYERARELEEKLRHDVVAHIHLLKEACPSAAHIIHLGATSCCVTDNADLVIMRDALRLIAVGIARVMDRLRVFAFKYRELPTLAYTHFQSAQLTTVGKRACLWLQDFLLDLEEVERVIAKLRFRGLKGATGTQDSYLRLFNGDQEKVRELDRLFGKAFRFERTFRITGQTYTRKQDTAVLSALASLGASAKKMATDLRLLAHDKEVEEPFEKTQVGSSAMPYKRNPMRSERDSALDRLLMNLVPNALQTHAEQWLERTLDDSATRRIAIAEAFLLADASLLIMQNVAEGLVVYPKVIEANIARELPFMATEEIILAMVKQGSDRQDVHEKIRVHSQAAGDRMKQEGKPNDLLKRVVEDPFFAPVHNNLDSLLDPTKFVGLAPEQVDEFLEEEVDPALHPFKGQLKGEAKLTL